MKLEIGMYVRTEDGIIGKIYEQIGDMFTYKDSYRDYITYSLLHNEIIKTSHNIIDLIQVGDYVNGYEITKIQEINKYYPKRLLFVIFPDNSVLDVFNNDNIKSIVTKELFESMQYKISKGE